MNDAMLSESLLDKESNRTATVSRGPVASHNSEINSTHKPALLCQLPEDVLCRVTSFLEANSLCEMRRLNQKYKRLASRNCAGWDHLCLDLWKNKVHVCQHAQRKLQPSSAVGSQGGSSDEDENESAMSAYRMSLLDGENRDHLRREELIFDPQTGKGTIWHFRFKEAAGSDWTAFDPWYNYQPCRKMVFLDDGKVKMYVPRQRKEGDAGQNENTESSGQAGTSRRNTNGSSGDGQSEGEMEIEDSTLRHPTLLDPRHNQVRPENSVNGSELQDPTVPMTWRFITQPMDFPDRPVGSYIRFSVLGREVPTYVCRRSPTNNWGFVMESCWGVYASFELPPRPRADDTNRFFRRRRRRQRRLRRALNIVQGREVHFEVEIEDSSDEDEEQEEDLNGDDALLWDDNFNVTTESQWREAFLYNNFAFPVLPEGSGALAEFQRNFGILEEDRMNGVF